MTVRTGLFGNVFYIPGLYSVLLFVLHEDSVEHHDDLQSLPAFIHLQICFIFSGVSGFKTLNL